MDEEREEWDGPWKEALESLALVLELFWPDVPGEVDLDKGCTPLEQELQKLTPDSSSGLLRVDKLFELAAEGTGDPRFAHFEAQMAKDPELPWRMFKYGRRAGEHFNQPVGRFAILGDDDPDWRPASYREGVLGCQDTFTFRVVKLLDWRDRLAELEAGGNLFGLFVCAHLETMATRRDVPGRREAKFRLLANLLRRDVSAAEFRRWYRLIDWIMKLPEEANRAVWRRLEALKEAKIVSHVTFAEIYGREKGLVEGRKEGLTEGRKEGLTEGRKEGLTEGRKEGLTEGLKESLREALEAKFPQEGPALAAAYQGEQDVERLRALLRHAVLALSPDDFRARAASPS
jgi:hypothetical protein